MDRISKPEVFGPGMWHSIHTLGKIADVNLKQLTFIIVIYKLLEHIPCSICRDHALEYYDKNDPNEYIGIKNEKGEDVGMFMWTWKFHNSVNMRLGKPFVEWTSAYSYYSGVTSKTCSLNVK